MKITYKNIIFEDNHLLIINKPNGIAVQNESQKGDLIDLTKRYLIEKFQKPGQAWLGTLHRLDQSVSGILIFAKTSKSASRLSEEIRCKKIDKTYLACVDKWTLDDEGSLQHYHKKYQHKAIVKSQKNTGFRKATLAYKVLHKRDDKILIAVKLETGFYHQIRSQFAHAGFPIVGDKKYGYLGNAKKGYIQLHSYKATFMHPTKKEKVTFKAPIPHFWNLKDKKEFDGILNLW